MQLDRRTGRPDSKSFPMTVNKKILLKSVQHFSSYETTQKLASLCDLEICKNCLVLAIKYVVFLYNVCWNYFHPSKHLAS